MKLKEKNRTAPTTTPAADAAPGKESAAAFKIGDGGAPFLPEAVQSNVIRSVNPQQARYIFFQIADPDAFRRFIRQLLDPSQGEPDSDFFDLPADMRTLWSEGWAHSYDEYSNRTV